MSEIRFTEKEKQTLTAAMAGNHPESLAPYRLSALRKLTKMPVEPAPSEKGSSRV